MRCEPKRPAAPASSAIALRARTARVHSPRPSSALAFAARAARLPRQRQRAAGADQVAEIELAHAHRAGLALHAERALDAVVALLLDLVDELRLAPVALPFESFGRDRAEEPELREPVAR